MKDAMGSMMYATIYRLYDMIYNYKMAQNNKESYGEKFYEFKSIMFDQIRSKYK